MREGVTTIPYGSTRRVQLPRGSALCVPTERKEIVYSPNKYRETEGITAKLLVY